jgi:hypothetical protein
VYKSKPVRLRCLHNHQIINCASSLNVEACGFVQKVFRPHNLGKFMFQPYSKIEGTNYLINLQTIPLNDKEHVLFFSHSFYFFYIYISWDPLLSTFSTLLFLGMILQAWHTCIWSLSQALSGRVGSVTAQLFSGLQRCSIGFESGLWLGCWMTFGDLSRNHSCVDLAVCLG